MCQTVEKCFFSIVVVYCSVCVCRSQTAWKLAQWAAAKKQERHLSKMPRDNNLYSKLIGDLTKLEAAFFQLDN